jgi:hypothetical protein
VYAKTYAVDVNTSRAPEEGTRSPKRPTGRINFLLIGLNLSCLPQMVAKLCAVFEKEEAALRLVHNEREAERAGAVERVNSQRRQTFANHQQHKKDVQVEVEQNLMEARSEQQFEVNGFSTKHNPIAARGEQMF